MNRYCHHHPWEKPHSLRNIAARLPLPATSDSDIGKHFHAFPKGTFWAHYCPPSIPKSILQHFAAHTPYWSWTTKAGPNAGKSFNVPTVPTACKKGSPRATQWIISLFHSFKAHLNPQALDPNGWVLPAHVRLYQNNMLIHLRGLLGNPLSQPTPASPPRPPPPQPNPTHFYASLSELEELWHETDKI